MLLYPATLDVLEYPSTGAAQAKAPQSHHAASLRREIFSYTYDEY